MPGSEASGHFPHSVHSGYDVGGVSGWALKESYIETKTTRNNDVENRHKEWS